MLFCLILWLIRKFDPYIPKMSDVADNYAEFGCS
jgi:hypothetical protein